MLALNLKLKMNHAAKHITQLFTVIQVSFAM